jgi:hypothetical protein
MKLEVSIPLFPAITHSGIQAPFNAYHTARGQRCLVSRVTMTGVATCYTLESAVPEEWHISQLQPYDPDDLWPTRAGVSIGSVSWIIDTEEISDERLPPRLRKAIEALRLAWMGDDKTQRHYK